MKNLIMAIVTVFVFTSCAHQHQKSEHHHHECDKDCKVHQENVMFEKHCAQSVLEGDTHVDGNDDFSLEHGGHIYYFSNDEKLEKFQLNIEANAKAAQSNWTNRAQRK